MIKKLVVTFLLLVSVRFINAQESDRLSVSYSNAPFTQLIKDIESKTSYRFFYTTEWVDTVRLNLSFQDLHVSEILKEAFKGSPLRFFILNTDIILTHNVDINDKIDTTLFIADRISSGSRFNYGFQRESQPQDENSREKPIIDVGIRGNARGGVATLSGYVRERKSEEAIPGATIYIPASNNSTTTDQFGFYSMVLPVGKHALTIRFVGMDDNFQRVALHSDGKVNFLMDEKITVLKELTVEAGNDFNVSSVGMGATRIDVKSMKNIPKVLGENDVFKIATTLPGVKTLGEGTAGLSVRGGNADQNLVTINEATIYNTAHFLGFFSVFNADAIKSFELYKSGIPVEFGGRLASVFEIQMKDANQKKFTGQGGIGPITSHLTFEVPLKKDKTSLMFGGRSTYSNWVLNEIPNDAVRNSKATFYDLFTRLTHNFSDKDALYVSAYYSKDKYNLSSDSAFSYSNAMASVQWRHIFSRNHFSVVSFSQSNYNYQLAYQSDTLNAFDLRFKIKESHFKLALSYDKGKHQFEYGIDGKLYNLNPGAITKPFSESLVTEQQMQTERGVESAFYLSDDIEITPALSLSVGLRYSVFAALGPRTVYVYDPNFPKQDNFITDTLTYGDNSIIKKYSGPEYRMSLRYKLSENTSVKASFNRTRQYIHMLSNTVSVSPINTWKLSDSHIAPQMGDQISFGFYRDLQKKTFEFSAEVYYKWLHNVVDYKTGSSLVLNENIEQDILQGQGKAYGVELLLRKNAGKFNGWIAYSYSRTFLRFHGNSNEETINNGSYFPANYDKPHDLSMITNYKFTRRYSLSLNFIYNTGRPITYPTGVYKFGTSYRINYSDRNQYRIPDYIRLDIGFNVEGTHRTKKLAHSFWTFSIYNLLGRNNPYSVYFVVEDDQIKGYKLSIFGSPIPTITYSFRF